MIVRYRQWEKKEAEKQAAQFAQQQQLMQQQGQNAVARQQTEAQGDKDNIYASGEVQAKIKQLEAQNEKQQQEIEGYQKLGLQKDRNQAQFNKSIGTLREKANLDSQKSFA